MYNINVFRPIQIIDQTPGLCPDLKRQVVVTISKYVTYYVMLEVSDIMHLFSCLKWPIDSLGRYSNGVLFLGHVALFSHSIMVRVHWSGTH